MRYTTDWESIMFFVTIIILTILCAGEPDLLDKLIGLVDCK